MNKENQILRAALEGCGGNREVAMSIGRELGVGDDVETFFAGRGKEKFSPGDLSDFIIQRLESPEETKEETPKPEKKVKKAKKPKKAKVRAKEISEPGNVRVAFALLKDACWVVCKVVVLNILYTLAGFLWSDAQGWLAKLFFRSNWAQSSRTARLTKRGCLLEGITGLALVVWWGFSSVPNWTNWHLVPWFRWVAFAFGIMMVVCSMVRFPQSYSSTIYGSPLATVPYYGLIILFVAASYLFYHWPVWLYGVTRDWLENTWIALSRKFKNKKQELKNKNLEKLRKEVT
jgi:hypothetical protein